MRTPGKSTPYHGFVQMREPLRIHVVKFTVLIRCKDNIMLNRSKKVRDDVQGSRECVSLVSGSLCPLFASHLNKTRATPRKRKDLFLSTEK